MLRKQLSEVRLNMKLKVNAKLDPQFEPLSLVVREMREATKENGQDIVIAVERNNGYVYRKELDPISVYVDSENNKYTSIDGVLYSKDKTILYNYPSGNKNSRRCF